MSSKKDVVKTAIPDYLKVEFKIICIQNELTISSMLEQLIEKIIEEDQDFSSDLNLEMSKSQIIKAYIPRDLKRKFKVFCVQKQIPMNLVLQYLIKTRIELEK